MKKYMRVCLLALTLLALMALPAFAGYDGVENKATDANVTIDTENTDKLSTVSYSAAQDGKQYLLLVLAGQNTLVPNEENILYVDQDAASGTTVTFTGVYPSVAQTSTVCLAGPGLDAPIKLADLTVSGVKVSGTVTSWNNTDDAVIRLYESTMTDEAIKADITGDAPTGVAATKGAIAENGTVGSNKLYSQNVSFATVTDGSYKLAIYKPGKYVPKIISVTVSGSAVDLGEIKMWLYGDVTYDGFVRTNDATEISLYLAFKASLTEEQQLAADVTQDGFVRTNDATEICLYLAFKDSVFDDLN